MKTRVLLLVLLAFVSSAGHAQKKILIDFNSKTVNTDGIKGITEGEQYQVEIKNLNQNLFKVSLFSKDTVISKEQKTPTFGNLSIDDISKIAANISSGSTLSSPQYFEFQDSFEYVNKSFAEFPVATRRVDTNQPIIDKMLSVKDFLEAKRTDAENLIKEIDGIKLEVYKEQMEAMRMTNAASVLDVAQTLVDIETIKQKLETLKTDVVSSKRSYESFFTNVQRTAIAADSELTANDKSIKETHDKLVSVINEVIASVSADKTKELLAPIIFIENNNGNTYTSLPLQFTGEQTRLKVTITPRDDKYNQHVYATQIKFPLTIKNYTVVGISFYGSNLHDRAYSFVKTPVTDSTAVYSIKKETASKAEIGVAALLRFGTKFGEKQKAGYHFSFGAGMSIADKVKPRMLLGGGFSLGKKHMLALDAGLIVGFVDRLSNTVDTKSTYNEKPENIMASKLALGGFLALGYSYQF